MTAPASPNRPRLTEWLHRLDRIAADLNTVLFVLAIGLAVLDLTVFVTNLAVAQIPVPAATAPAAAAQPLPWSR